MSEASPGEGSGQPGPEQDPWSAPADFGRPGSGEAPPPWPGQPSPPPSAPGGPGHQPSGNGFSPAGADPSSAPPPGYGPPSPGQYGYGYQAPYYSAPLPRNNPLAIAALVCGIVQFLGGLVVFGNILLAIPAVICASIGLRQIKERRERGRGLAIAGLVLGILGIAYFVLIVLAVIIFGSVHAGGST